MITVDAGKAAQIQKCIFESGLTADLHFKNYLHAKIFQ